ncbi:MAG: hypothetical protein Q9M31_03205 [Mariprofundus sp.]|nr:hypothetical protein [Mariprofundus sp.]
MSDHGDKNNKYGITDFVSDISDAQDTATSSVVAHSHVAGHGLGKAALSASIGSGPVPGYAMGLGAIHHAALAAGGGAGGGLLAGKASGLKLGLGLHTLMGPIILGSLLGLGSYALFKYYTRSLEPSTATS